MLSMKSFVISDQDDEIDFVQARDRALTLDRLDFATDGYPVDELRFPRVGSAVTKGKGRADEEDEVEGVEDTTVLGGSPSSSTIREGDDDSVDDDLPLERISISTSETGDDSGDASRRLVFPELEALNIVDRPWSAPSVGRSSGRGGPSAKRRKVSSADGRSPLGRVAVKDDRLLRLEQKIEESNRERMEMFKRMQEREAEMQRLQDQRDAEAKEALETQRKNHMELVQMFAMAMAKQKDVEVAPVAAAPPVVEPSVEAMVSPVLASAEFFRPGPMAVGACSSRSQLPPLSPSRDSSLQEQLPSPPSPPPRTRSQGDVPETSSGPPPT